MTQDDIIRMALEHFGAVLKPSDMEVKLAALAVAAEREACAKVAENTYDRQIVWYPKGHYIDPNSLGDINKAVAEGCAEAIRTSGET